MGADITGAQLEDAGNILADQVIKMMKATDMPNGLSGVGYSEADLKGLTDGSFPQKRLLDNAPKEVTWDDLYGIYKSALKYW